MALLGMVAVASHGHLHRGGPGPAPSRGFFNYAFSIFLILFVLTIPFALYVWWSKRREIAAVKFARKGSRPAGLGILFLFLLLAYLVWYASHNRKDNPAFRMPLLSPKGPKGGHRGIGAVPYEPHFQWLPLVVLALLALGAAGAAYLVHRRRQLTEGDPTVAESLAHVFDLALDDIMRERDPRKAVIAAYGRMEEVLTAYGMPREPHKTPFEYLADVLLGLNASAAATRRLTDLFERAKFSRHEIDLAMKDEAIAALSAIRDELRPEEEAA